MQAVGRLVFRPASQQGRRGQNQPLPASFLKVPVYRQNMPESLPPLMKKHCLLFLLLAGLMACDQYPRDPEKTLSGLRQGRLRVGYSENPPWVVKTAAAPTGIEPALLVAFAKTQQTHIEWVADTEQDLMEQLKNRELHLVVGGLTHNSPWSHQVSFSRPYLKQGREKRVMGVIKGENAFVLELEKFLLGQEGKIKASLQP
jgi:polar amino acid transport system substrate-binding protein